MFISSVGKHIVDLRVYHGGKTLVKLQKKRINK